MNMSVANYDANHLKLLVEISGLFTLHNIDEVLQNLVDLATRAVDAVDASLIVNPDHTDDLKYFVHLHALDEQKERQAIEQILNGGLAGWVRARRQPARIDDTHDDDRWHRIEGSVPHFRSAVSVPVIHRDVLLAVLTVVHTDVAAFTDYHINLLTIIVNQAALGIHNAQLYEQSRAQQHLLQTVLHSIPEALIVINSDSCVLDANPSALKLLGIDPRQKVIGEELAHMLEGNENLAPVIKHLMDAQTHPKTASPLEFETHLDQLNRDLYITLAPWYDDRHDRHGFVLILHDITQIRDLDRFKDEMMRMASHDLRSPLNLIMGYADLIAMAIEDMPSPLHEYVDIIQQASQRMSMLLEDMLRADHVRRSPLELRETVNPGNLVKLVVANMRPSAASKELTLDAYLDLDDVPEIVIDPVLIRQAMENYISNALKYSPPGGTVKIYASRESDRFKFLVEDNGIGIAANVLDRVFQPFYRVRNNETEQSPGTGVGLSLVKDVVERHGGEVWVNSKPGEGSQFGFSLPINTTSSPACTD